jgi:ABC-2 type transport system ATP-binding protein
VTSLSKRSNNTGAAYKENNNMHAVIETHAMTHRYAKVTAVQDLQLSVPEGSIYAFLGPNGAGKTTTIKLLLNLLQPTEGRATVLGVDSTRLGPAEFAQIGYVSENQQLPDWMTVQQLIDFCRPMYRTWDADFCSRMLKDFRLPPDRKLKNLSRGMRMKAKLLTSLAYHPRLLVLDEPFTGLDPLVRDEVIRGILELTEQEKWSVFISSHDIDELERFADWIGFIDGGSLRVSESTADLCGRFKRLDCVIPAGSRVTSAAPRSWLVPEIHSSSFSFIESEYSTGESERRLATLFPGATDVTAMELSLREIFIALAQESRRQP